MSGDRLALPNARACSTNDDDMIRMGLTSRTWGRLCRRLELLLTWWMSVGGAGSECWLVLPGAVSGTGHRLRRRRRSPRGFCLRYGALADSGFHTAVSTFSTTLIRFGTPLTSHSTCEKQLQYGAAVKDQSWNSRRDGDCWTTLHPAVVDTPIFRDSRSGRFLPLSRTRVRQSHAMEVEHADPE